MEAVSALDPKPRGPRWVSLSSCLIDAVWSIGSNYDAVTVPITRGVFAACAGDHADPLVPGDDLATPDPIPLDDFTACFREIEELAALTNRQRTSPRGGILKADAALQYAAVLAGSGVQTRQDGLELMHDDPRFAEVDARLSRVPGDGADGVRRGYLWMLLGDDSGIKPDRMVLRWLAFHGANVKASEASMILRRIAPHSNCAIRAHRRDNYPMDG